MSLRIHRGAKDARRPVVYGATHVWLDHDTFTDGDHPDSSLPVHYGRIYQQHDGELDIVKGADHVTVSWNVFADHDKTILIGNSDSAATAAADRGHLKVTLHHNLFTGLVERAPRVRFGQVDSYDNHFVADSSYGYSYGIGMESRLVAEHNAFTLPASVGVVLVTIPPGPDCRGREEGADGAPGEHTWESSAPGGALSGSAEP